MDAAPPFGFRSISPLSANATPFVIGEDYSEAQKAADKAAIDRFMASAANPDDILAEVVATPAFNGNNLIKLAQLTFFSTAGPMREMLYRLARESAALNFPPKSEEKNDWLHAFEALIFSPEEIKSLRAERKAAYAKAQRKGDPFSAEEKFAYKRKIIGQLRDFLRTLVGKFFIAEATGRTDEPSNGPYADDDVGSVY